MGRIGSGRVRCIAVATGSCPLRRQSVQTTSAISSAFSLSDILAGAFIPWRGGTDESGAAKFLLDLLGPPDGEVAAACRCRFLFSDYDWRWRSGGGLMVPAPARGRGSNWRRPDRDNWAVDRNILELDECRQDYLQPAEHPCSEYGSRDGIGIYVKTRASELSVRVFCANPIILCEFGHVPRRGRNEEPH